MGRWRPLPGDLPIEVVRLVRELRLCLDRCEASAATVAAKTGYSRSSWRRYVNGSRLPPWPAVEALGRMAHADREQLRVLWESAAHAWQKRQPLDTGAESRSSEARRAPDLLGPAGEPPPHASSPSAVRSRGRPRVVAGAPMPLVGVAAVCVVLAVVVLVWPWRAGSADRPPEGVPTGVPAWPYPLASGVGTPVTGCRSTACEGLDPGGERCDGDRVTVHRLRAYGQVLELFYSPACQASWAEVEPAGSTARLRISTRGGEERAAPAGAVRTAMIAGGPGSATATVVVHGHQLGVTRFDSWIDRVTGTGSG
ncbi:XRE family transcriptional regulator [Streptomyces sp. SP2-10]|uniref:helix-turn-helix domain-containing protein n=1 Tax=Streptomyces sp. SP2-10 TaxID=2873385 RepID=UPI001CA6BC42|nr:XRE family transcriptional regulator [Streptomyces sp. SP2-10]MBY8846535.1 XRE family transcriptional regulator [Streptomyces sp. SP2-10]